MSIAALATISRVVPVSCIAMDSPASLKPDELSLKITGPRQGRGAGQRLTAQLVRTNGGGGIGVIVLAGEGHL
ncbi:hypothetical protein [Loktanella sp. R86503]|uniref:hypothetical protein n=1 Tax=Loktanella sp. R86503 TaxID=3093847 RepID=UPI0036D8B470